MNVTELLHLSCWLQQLPLSCCLPSLQLLRDVRYFERDEPGMDAILLATRLSAVGYDVSVRNALGGGGGSCFRYVCWTECSMWLRGGGAQPLQDKCLTPMALSWN